jgi:protein-disulfide isomerase
MADLEKEIKKEEKKVEKFFSKKANVWMTVAIVAIVVLIVSLVFNFVGAGMSANAAGTKLVNFLNTEVVQGGGVELSSVTSDGDLYIVNVTYQGRVIPVQMTKDGKYFIQGATPISSSDRNTNSGQTQEPPKDVPKSDKPVVDLYVFTHCPYGTQTEKGFIPVYNLLKNKADMNIVFIGAMHGQYEETESLRQLCINKIYGKDKMMSYILKFDTNASIGSCGSNEACSKPIVNSIMKSLGISSSSVETCMTKDAPALYSADQAKAASLGIGGSPTFTVNGVEVSSGRSPAAILQTVCNAFTTPPSECSQTLDNASPSAGFGATASESASAASCG